MANGTSYGGDDVDVLSVTQAGTAHGGNGNDILTGSGYLYSLYGEVGSDTFNLNTTGDAYGGDGGDIYNVNATTLVGVTDTGTTGNDYVYLNNIATVDDVVGVRVGDNLYVTSETCLGTRAGRGSIKA